MVDSTKLLNPAEDNAFSNGKDKRKKSILYIALPIITLLVVATAGIAVVTKSQENASSSYSYVHPVVKSTCAVTRYPDLCLSTIASATAATSSRILTPRDVLLASLKHTITKVHQNYGHVRSITFARVVVTKRERVALHDCLETMDATLAQLQETFVHIRDGGNQFKKYTFHQIDKVKALISAAMTNQDTCLDGFSHEKAEKAFREKLLDGRLMYVSRLCSNILAMFHNLTAAELDSNPEKKVEHSVQESMLSWMDDSEDEWPSWLSAADKKLLLEESVTPDVTVDANGNGNYKTVSEAVAASPNKSSKRFVIKIKAGDYKENVDVPSSKTNLMFIGDGQKTTLITSDRSVKLGDWTTYSSATVAINAKGFLARDITFRNIAGPEGEQAVALRVSADFTAFYKCGMIAYQDTLYVHTHRQFYRACYVAGTIDFIFGNSAVVFQDCDIHARKPGPKQKNMITAQGRTESTQDTGIVIQSCRIGATKDLQEEISKYPTYLGRPWKKYSRTVIMLTDISGIINPAGWHRWNDSDFALDTLYYAEYKNTGAGADTSQRVKWKGYHVLTNSAQVEQFTAKNFIDGESWLGSTGFPYTLGLS